MMLGATASAAHVLTIGGITLDAGSWANWFAGIASFSAVCVALMGQRISASRDRKGAAAKKVEIAQQIGFKLWRLCQRNENLREVFEVDVPVDMTPGDRVDLWKWIKPPVASTYEPLSLVAEETNLLIAYGELDYLLEFSLAVDRHDAILSNIAAWRELYLRLDAVLQPKEVSLDVIQHAPSEDERLKIERIGVAVNFIIGTSIDSWNENLELLHRLADKFNPMMKRHLKLKTFIALEKI